MLVYGGVTLYFVKFLDPGKSINRVKDWNPQSYYYDSSNNNNETGPDDDSMPSLSLQPSFVPTAAPSKVSEMTNVVVAFMVLEPLAQTLPSDAAFAWTVVTSSRIQESILANERLSVFYIQTRVLQQTIIPGGVVGVSNNDNDNDNDNNNDSDGRQQRRIQGNSNNDALLIQFESTFFSGTFDKEILEQEIVGAFEDDDAAVQAYLLELQQSNNFFLFQALQDAYVTLSFSQVTFPPTTDEPPTTPNSTMAPVVAPTTPNPTTTAPVITITIPPTTSAPTPFPTTSAPTPFPTIAPIATTPPPTTPAPITPNPTTPMPSTLSPSDPPTSSPVNPTPAPTAASPAPTELPLTILGEFELLEVVPHDSTSFTQGLELVPGSAPPLYYESIGLYGVGAMRIVDLNSGVTLQEHLIDDEEIFAFGLTRYNNQILHLTWRAGIGFIYDAVTLEELGTFPVNTTSGEGWGICHDTTVNPELLYVSDGTTILHTWDAASKELISKVEVTSRTDPDATEVSTVRRVNELEWDRFSNTILSNVWQKDFIIRIDPATGFVTHQYDLATLDRPGDANVLNGIALTNVPNEIWVTGKLWPSMYRIRLI
jgi:glutamine cyclotransferase